MAEWRDKQKSVSRELGWGNSKEGLEKKKKQPTWIDYDSVLVCPVCHSSKQFDIIRRRDDFWECRKCGFMDDEMNWDKQALDKNGRKMKK